MNSAAALETSTDVPPSGAFCLSAMPKQWEWDEEPDGLAFSGMVGKDVAQYAFAAYLPADIYDIRTIQELVDRRDVSTTMIYTHMLNRGPVGVYRPLDKP